MNESERFIISYDSGNKQKNAKSHHPKNKQFSVEIRIDESTMTKELSLFSTCMSAIGACESVKACKMNLCACE